MSRPMFVGVRWEWVPEGNSWVSDLGVIVKKDGAWHYSLVDDSARLVGPFMFPSFAARGAFQRRKPHDHEKPFYRAKGKKPQSPWARSQRREAVRNLNDILSGKRDLMDPKRFRSS